VVGASGYVGQATARHLVRYAKTHDILLGVRDIISEKAEPLRELGHAVTLVPADMGRPDLLKTVMREATAVFIVVPGAFARVAHQLLRADLHTGADSSGPAVGRR
jgi:uncharacterized protein YbjT (DUF2867 family)